MAVGGGEGVRKACVEEFFVLWVALGFSASKIRGQV